MGCNCVYFVLDMGLRKREMKWDQSDLSKGLMQMEKAGSSALRCTFYCVFSLSFFQERK